jgi:biopolymer transport protein ExbD
MRIKGAKQVHYDAGPNMTPLVDVVMVILIFLMLAGKFGGDEQYLASTVPVKKGGSGDVKDAISKDTDFRITVDPLPDRFIARVGDQQVSDEDSLTALLTTKAAEFAQTSPDGKLDNIQVIIDPGRTVKYMYLIQAYEAANNAGFTKVAFQQPH